MYIGSHVSIREGYVGAAEWAKKQGGNAFQFFSKNPRALSVKTWNERDAAACAAFCEREDVRSVIHSPYPTNLGTDDADKKCLTIQSIINDLHIAEACGSIGVVVHFGYAKTDDPLVAYKLIIHMLNDVLAKWDGKALILLENQSGQRGRMGMTMEELVKVRELCREPERIGFCLDTCHAFATGMWNGHNDDQVIRTGEDLGFFEHVHAVHFNDSMEESGSFRDRHAPIGRGRIGLEALGRLLSWPFSPRVPFILETPKGLDGTHREELRIVKQLRP